MERAFQILAMLKEGHQFAAKAGGTRRLDRGRSRPTTATPRTPDSPLHEWLVTSGVLSRDQLDVELHAFLANAGTSVHGDVEYSPVAELEIPLPRETIFKDNGAMIPDFARKRKNTSGSRRPASFLVLDGDSTNTEALNAIYRGFHTIKAWRMLGLAAIQNSARGGKPLNLARDGKLVPAGKHSTLLRQHRLVEPPGSRHPALDPASREDRAGRCASRNCSRTSTQSPASGKPVAEPKSAPAKPAATAATRRRLPPLHENETRRRWSSMSPRTRTRARPPRPPRPTRKRCGSTRTGSTSSSTPSASW